MCFFICNPFTSVVGLGTFGGNFTGFGFGANFTGSGFGANFTGSGFGANFTGSGFGANFTGSGFGGGATSLERNLRLIEQYVGSYALKTFGK